MAMAMTMAIGCLVKMGVRILRLTNNEMSCLFDHQV